MIYFKRVKKLEETRVLFIIFSMCIYFLGMYMGKRETARFYKKYNEMNLKLKRLERCTQNLKNKAGLNNSTKDDMGGK